MSTAQEKDTDEGRGYSSGEGVSSSNCDFLWARFNAMFAALSNHVWFKEASFQENVVIIKGFEDGSQNLFSNSLADFDAVITITEDFGFNNGNNSVILADSGISGKSPSIFLDRKVGWASITNFEYGSPFGESNTLGVVFLAHGIEGIKSLGGVFILGSWKNTQTFINFNSWDDAFAEQEVNEILSIMGALISGFRE